MANIGYDDLVASSGTALSAHTSDSGHSWTVKSGTEPYRIYGSSPNNVCAPDGTAGRYSFGATPTSADYSVTNTYNFEISDNVVTSQDTLIRGTWNGSNQYSGYAMRMTAVSTTSGQWELYEVTTDTYTLLNATATSISFSDDTQYDAYISCEGSGSSGIITTVDGSPVCGSPNSAADHTSAGLSGIGTATPSGYERLTIVYFTVDELAAAAASNSRPLLLLGVG